MNDNEAPLVSVVVPTYLGDSPEHLAEAVGSALSQTLRSLEVIVVLDGPVSDAARQRLDALGARDQRLRVLALEANRGPAAARNAGIAAAQGQWVALLDADDMAEPQRLERQLAWMTRHEADVGGSWYTVLDAQGRPAGMKQTPVGIEGVHRWLAVFNPIANSTVTARAAVLKAHPYPVGRRAPGPAFDGEDYDLWVNLARAGYALGNQPEALVRFRADARFIERRRGWRPFRTDLRTKWRALRLQPAWRRALLAPVAVGVSTVRLMPRPIVRLAYRLRDAVRFGGAHGGAED